MHSMERQKIGPPYIHVLMWLKEKFITDPIDKTISAQTPDSNNDTL